MKNFIIKHIPMQESFLNMRNRKGQVLPYMLIMSIVLILSWAMMLNIAKVLRDKMILQNTVDNAVLSIANLSARTLNLLGQTNYLMATLLSTAGYPESLTFDILFKKHVPVWMRYEAEKLLEYTPRLYVPSFSTDKVCGSMIPGPLCDYKCNSISTRYKGVKLLRETVQGIQKFQDLLLDKIYAFNYLLLLQQFSKDDMTILVMPSRFAKNITDFNLSSLANINSKDWLGIKRNSKKIKYYKTKNYCFNIKAVHVHFVGAEEYKTDEYSWYVQDENFYDKKFVAIGRKSLNKNYPLFKGIFGIKMPSLTAFSAAGVYNVKGPMLPEKETVYTGANLAIAALSSFVLLTKQFEMLVGLGKYLAGIVPVGTALSVVIGILAGDMLATSIYNYNETTKDKQTPIYKYNEAKDGGWDAHLIPL